MYNRPNDMRSIVKSMEDVSHENTTSEIMESNTLLLIVHNEAGNSDLELVGPFSSPEKMKAAYNDMLNSGAYHEDDLEIANLTLDSTNVVYLG